MWLPQEQKPRTINTIVATAINLNNLKTHITEIQIRKSSINACIIRKTRVYRSYTAIMKLPSFHFGDLGRVLLLEKNTTKLRKTTKVKFF